MFSRDLSLKVAFVHDWLVTYRGGEKVLEALLELYPEAPIYTLFHTKSVMPESISKRRVITPKGLGIFKPLRKALLPFLPTIIESFDLSEYDLVISTSSCVAKGVIVRPDAKHICYLHTPMRYIWDQRQEYLGKLDRIPILNLVIEALVKYLRKWDVRSSQRVTRFVANSTFVRERVQKYYGRDAEVIHPPVDIRRFTPSKSTKKAGYFLAAGAFVPYKRFDLAIEACEKLGKKLIIAGSGPMESKLRNLAQSQTTFVIAPNAQEWVDLLQKADALIFPGVEDFGMIPIECMASGTPVLALKRGGALDYIKPGKTGEFFNEQSSDAIAKAITDYRASAFEAQALVGYAHNFNKERFMTSMRAQISELLKT